MPGRGPVQGVLLALAGDDSDLVRAIDAPGTGMSVVRRCADLAELTSAVLAGLAELVIVGTELDDVDRPALERMRRSGARGVLVAPAGEVDRWVSSGWAVESADADASRVVARLESMRAAPGSAPPPPGPAAGPTSAPTEGSTSGTASRRGRREAERRRGGENAAGTDGRGAERGVEHAPGSVGRAAGHGGPVPGSGGPVGATGGSGLGTDEGLTATSGQASELWEEFDATSAGGPRKQADPAPGAARATPGSAPEPHRPDASARAGSLATAGRSGGTGADAAVPTAQDPGAHSGAPRPGRLVVVWGPHGAPGRSTVAAALAHGLAGAGGSILVDADVEAPCLAQLLDVPEDASSLATAARLAAHGRLDGEGLDRLLLGLDDARRLLTGLGRAGRWRELPASSMEAVWDCCRAAAAWTVVDVAGGVPDDAVDGFTLEPGRGAVAADLIRSAEVLVVVGAGDPIGVRRLLQALEALEELGPRGRVEVVVNKVRSSAAGPGAEGVVREALARFGGVGEVSVLPADPRTADQCVLAGADVLEGAPGSPLARALAGLADRIEPAAGAGRSPRARRSVRGLLESWTAARAAD